MKNWKALTGFFFFAVFISILSGVIKGNPFGVIMLRALLSGIFFISIGAGGIYVLKKYLPGFLNPNPLNEEGAAQEDGDTKGQVDIVLPEETPPYEREESEDYELEKEEGDGTELPEIDSIEEAEMEGELTEDEGEPKPLEELSENESDIPDTLPDLDTLGNNFSPETRKVDRSHINSSKKDRNTPLSNNDPESLAKAVRTIINKD